MAIANSNPRGAAALAGTSIISEAALRHLAGRNLAEYLLLTFHDMDAELTTCSSDMGSLGTSKPASRELLTRIRASAHRLREVLAHEKPLTALGLLARKVTRPIVAWEIYHVYSGDVNLTPPARQVGKDVSIRLFQGEEVCTQVQALLSATRLRPSVISSRLRRGDLLAVAFEGKKVAGYAWTAFQTAYVPEIGMALVLNQAEVMEYDEFVLPDWRGFGIHYQLELAMLRYQVQRGCRAALSIVDAFNTRSIRSQLRIGKRRFMSVLLVQLSGGRLHRFGIGTPLHRRFVSGEPDETVSTSSGGDAELAKQLKLG